MRTPSQWRNVSPVPLVTAQPVRPEGSRHMECGCSHRGVKRQEVEGVLEVCVWGGTRERRKSNQIHMGPLLWLWNVGHTQVFVAEGQERQEMGTMLRCGQLS